MTTEPTQHPIRASNCNRAYACPPSIWRELDFPDEQSPAAAEGSLLHAAIAARFRHEPWNKLLTPEQEGVVRACYDGYWAGLGICDSPRVEQTLIVRDSDYELIFDRPVTADVVTFNEEHGVIID